MVGNILEFPKSAIVRDTTEQTSERLAAYKEQGIKNFADVIANDIAEDIAINISACGIEIESLEFQKDFTLLYGVLAGMIYRSLDLTHPMQKFIDDSIQVTSLQDENQNELPLE